MTTTTSSSDIGSGRSRTAVSGNVQARSASGSWARHLWAWLTNTGYRPERHYMPGSRTGSASGPQPRPA
jgi:hypothetical protein